jgi:uracil-DNA glycosylase family protein
VKIQELRAAAVGCQDCDLYERATQTVFGEGPPDADLMLMGEQPGDQEDRFGLPFVGPAGRILDEGLRDAGIDREQVYVTNAVKHFRWRPAGKVRLHVKPNARQVAACRQWWERELEVVDPRLLMCLGATAAQAVFGSKFRITRQRGEYTQLPSGVWATATIHPSAILRVEEGAAREEAYAGFVGDLRGASQHLKAA